MYKYSTIGAETYKRLPVFAHEGLHEYVDKLVNESLLPEARVLELGSGSGAFSLRLQEAGFHLTCSDLTAENFGNIENTTFIEADLNGAFETKFEGMFDAVISLEVIEHLENPWQFLREIMKLVQPGGAVIISTPNIGTPRSILSFIKNGAFKYFQNWDFTPGGHITPISQLHLVKIIERAGFINVRVGSAGSPWGSGVRHLGAKILSLLMRNNPTKIGAISVCIAERPKK
jgi:SAM-dependent methyltransferase